MENLLKTIQVDRIANMMLAANEDGTAAIAVIDDMGGVTKHPLTNGFRINECTEFLRSLGLDDIIVTFYSFEQYRLLIQSCMEMLKIQRVMKQQRSLGKVPASEVHSLILDTLDDEGIDYSMIYLGNLPRYVKRATKAVRKHNQDLYGCKRHVSVG